MNTGDISMLKYFSVHKKNKVLISGVLRILTVFFVIFIGTLLSPLFFEVQVLQNYLPLHTFLESFSIVVAMLVAGIGLNTYKYQYKMSGNIIFISMIFFSVGILDLTHILSYNGMPDFITPSSPDKAIYFWLSARFISTIGLLLFSISSLSLLASKKSRIIFMMLMFILICVIHLPLFYGDFLLRDVFFVAGSGLTPLKIYSEYFIVALSVITAIILFKRMQEPQAYSVIALFGAVCMIIMSEFLFTLYTDVTDLYNIMGHIYKVIAYLFIYRAVFVTAIEEPFEEINKQEKIMMMQSRQAIMGEMISMIAHQWRQPISAISMEANNILADIAFDSVDVTSLEKMAKQINMHTQELSKTIDDFSNFFTPNQLKELTMISSVMEDTFLIIGKSFENNNITVQINEINKLEEINTYPRELMQVFINISNNAKDILVEKKIINPMLTISCEQRDDKSAIISICDNGGGIQEDIIDKIFDPYFSTKKEKNGTGLGLYMSKMIIEKHLFGTISVYNTDDGACFKIELPYAIGNRDA
ncbi:MAG: hypothetical protein H8E76_10035 [Helicobacteraceae bacterium]|nr:hypothetical protein [Candidatus Sulfurimonas ponti]